MKNTYRIKKTNGPDRLDGQWQEPEWQKAETLTIDNYMGDKPEHFPCARARLLYDENNLYVIFRVEDNYVRAAAQHHFEQVCRDSCAEFFFTPNDDINTGYFNFEINCGGKALVYHQTARAENTRQLQLDDIEKLKINHSCPTIIEAEITEPTAWTISYKIPFDMLRGYTVVQQPAPGVKWMGNFYKCGDETSHPHWLTWNVIDLPKPDFHRPEFFGILEFE